jgi:hypothetical protein
MFSIGQTDASAENVTRLSERASLSIISQTTRAVQQAVGVTKAR